MASENNGIYFTELKLKNVRCFGDDAVLKLSNDKGEWSRWNVILGDNGTGKSTLLQCLAGFELVPRKIGNDVRGYETKWVPKLDERDHETLLGPNGDVFAVNPTIAGFGGMSRYYLGYSGTSRHKMSGYGSYEYIDLFILGYGANRRISFNIFSEKEIEPSNSETLFDDDAKLINAEEWLYQMDYAAIYAEKLQTEAKENSKQRRDLVFEVIKHILPDIEGVEVDVKPSPAIPFIKFKTPYGWRRLPELSYGYKTMVAWIVDVAARMFKKYPDSANPLEEPVVILVDEIDLHLHPKWQRQIFDFLESRFPRAQFIVTAHSPLIVQSAPKDANIIVLKKEKVDDGYVVKIDNDVESVRTWRIDQIMQSDLFGIESARNPEIEAQMKERTNLMQKDELNDAEKDRLTELNKISHNLPTAHNLTDIEAMRIIRDAADFLKNKGAA